MTCFVCVYVCDFLSTEVLQDWRLLTDLLLADKSAPDLTNNQQSILIRLLVASARKITAEESKKKAMTERVSVCSCWVL